MFPSRQYPDILTAGVFKRAGAKREQLKKMTFTVTQVGHGWSEALLEGTDEYSNPPDSSIIIKVKTKAIFSGTLPNEYICIHCKSVFEHVLKCKSYANLSLCLSGERP